MERSEGRHRLWRYGCGLTRNKLYQSILHLIYNMGLTSLVKNKQQPPSILNLQQCQRLILDTAQLLTQNKLQLKLLVTFDMNSFKYHPKGWRRSTISCYVSNFGLPTQEHPQGNECIFDMQQIYNIHELIKHFRKQKQVPSDSRQTAKGDDNEQKQCCICFDHKATTMLPCSHSYCAMCTSKYIIQQEEHRCPQCRRQFRGNKKSINKEFYQVIQQDRMVYEQARNHILQHLAKYSPQTTQLLQYQASKYLKP